MLLLITLFLCFLSTIPNEVDAEVFLTGSQTLEIADFYVVKQGIINKNSIRSDLFTVGGYQWAIEFYPHGFDTSVTDYVSIGLRLVNSKNAVRAMHTSHLKDWNTGFWSVNTPYSPEVNTYKSNQLWGQSKFIKRSDLEASKTYLRNYALVVKTTVWVVKDSSSVLLPALAYDQWNITTADISFGNNTNQQANA